jgi:hypothetical protein
MQKLLLVLLALAASSGVVAWVSNPAIGAERDPTQVLVVENLFHPESSVMELVAERFRVAGEHNAKVRHADVNRELKGDRLTPETLAIQYQGLLPDGTPIEEVEVHVEN